MLRYSLIILLTWHLSLGIAQAQTANLCFFSPETNINNRQSLEKSLNTFFNKTKLIHFQTFTDANELEQFRKQQGCQLSLLSNRFFTNNQARYQLKAYLNGMLNGQNELKKILSTINTIDDVAALNKVTIASSSSVANTRKELTKLLGQDHEDVIRSIQILEVPKDLDALMSIHYGVASAAITSMNSFELFRSLNPKQARKLHVIGKELVTLLPVVAGEQRIEDTLNLLKKMGESRKGKRKLLLLGLDGFSDTHDPEKGGAK